jgi:trans-aconitate methyltransferase
MADYRNFRHYIGDGWNKEPKESFRAVADHLGFQKVGRGSLLDVGCATGELLGFLGLKFPELSLTGVDVFDDLLVTASQNLPAARFIKASALDLSQTFPESFDVVTAIGVMSIFDETQLLRFWQNLLDSTRPGGLIIVLAPLNEFGVDSLISHRKRQGGRRLDWEGGWNIFSLATVSELLAELGQEVNFERFVFKSVLLQREDPVRTWTLPTESNPHQLTNGLKLLVDHYFIVVKKL